MDILLTGASGFLGRNFILRAPDAWRILGVYWNDSSFPAFIADLAKSNLRSVRCNLTDPTQVTAMLDTHGREWEYCVYLAAKVNIPWSVVEPKEDFLVNAGSLLNLLRGLRTRRFLFMSSGAVYDGLRGEVQPGIRVNPRLPYAISKLACEQYLLCYQEHHRTIDDLIILRFFGAYGPYEAAHKIHTRLVRAFAIEGRDTYTVYGDGTNLIDAMYIDDAVDGLQKVLAGNHWNTTSDFAARNPMTIEALVREVGQILGFDSVQIKSDGIAREDIRFWAARDNMREAYGFEPKVGLSDGITRLRDFLVTIR